MDLKEIFYYKKKKGGPSKSQALINNFRNFFVWAMIFFEPGFSRYRFTWCNYWQKSEVAEEQLDRFAITSKKREVVKEWLDRFCGFIDWSLLFPDAFVSHIDRYISNHLPILLRCATRKGSYDKSQKGFGFENMWVIAQSCEGVIALSWANTIRGGIVDGLYTEVESCAIELL